MSEIRFSYEEAFSRSLEYFDGDELAANVAVTKYLLADGDGQYFEATPGEMHERIADELHRVESKYPNAMSREEI